MKSHLSPLRRVPYDALVEEALPPELRWHKGRDAFSSPQLSKRPEPHQHLRRFHVPRTARILSADAKVLREVRKYAKASSERILQRLVV